MDYEAAYERMRAAFEKCVSVVEKCAARCDGGNCLLGADATKRLAERMRETYETALNGEEDGR